VIIAAIAISVTVAGIALTMGSEDMGALFLIVVLIVIAELIVSGTWQRFYFTTGIPLFKKSIRLPDPPELSENLLNERFPGGFWVPLRFKQMSPHEIAFRETLICFHFMNYTPVMHGLVRYDQKMNELHVIGFANWFIVALIIFFASSFPDKSTFFL